MKNSLTKIVVINFLVLLISILFIEIFFGNWFSEHNFGPYMREHRLKKNPVVLTYKDIQYKYIYKRNYHGFRGEEMDPSEIEAVIIGGSTIDERYKPYELSITGNLNSLLKKNDYNFEITNAGIEGQSTAGHIYNFEHWFPKLKNFSPKLYIFYIGLNDYNSNYENENYNTKGNDGHVRNPEAIEVFFDSFKSSSFIYDKLRKIKQKYYTTAKIMKYDHNFFGLQDSKNYEYINYEKALKLHDLKELKLKYQGLISGYLHRVKILNNHVKKRNAVPIFINQVNFEGVRNERLFIINHSLIEYCMDKNLYCIDLADKFNGKFNYWFDDVHTTGEGSKLIAETLINDLIEIVGQGKIY